MSLRTRLPSRFSSSTPVAAVAFPSSRVSVARSSGDASRRFASAGASGSGRDAGEGLESSPRVSGRGGCAVSSAGASPTCNDGAELERLFEERHGSGRYRLYNLCAERSYGPDRFGGAFCRFPFQDHAPPPKLTGIVEMVDIEELGEIEYTE